jgi:hypothetical protein
VLLNVMVGSGEVFDRDRWVKADLKVALAG